eukprot:COSAG06_NODE_63514_length_262_cov_0.631902_1_plen_41_part_01
MSVRHCGHLPPQMQRGARAGNRAKAPRWSLTLQRSRRYLER